MSGCEAGLHAVGVAAVIAAAGLQKLVGGRDTLAHQGVVQVQFVELILMRTVVVQIFTLFYPVHEQVVQRTVGYELQRWKRGRSYRRHQSR